MTVTTEQQLRSQEEQARRARGEEWRASRGDSTAVVPATNGGNLPATPDTRSSVQAYLDEVAPAGIAGRLIKWSKGGEFIFHDTDEPISEETDFVALCHETLVGLMKFNPDAPPDRIMGLLYDGFQMPDRAALGDNDPAKWPIGLDGKPADPWQHMIYLVLQHGDTAELATFTTSSKTGRRAVGNLLRHYDRMLRTHPGELPVVRLKKGGFQHRDERIGWVATPAFAVVGRAPMDSVAKPDSSPAADMDDKIPF
jgi:hypothetical protein